jgi:hypothetical protein
MPVPWNIEGHPRALILGPLFTTIGAGNLRAFVQRADDLGLGGLSK